MKGLLARPSQVESGWSVPWRGADRAGTPVHVRRAGRRDAPRLIELVRALVQETPYMLQAPEDNLPSVAEQRLVIEHLDRQPNCFCIVAIRPGWAPGRGTLLGSLTCLGGRGARTRHAAQISMGVRKSAWGLGIGGFLLDAAIHWAKGQSEVARLGLQVYAANGPARRLYEQRGFLVEGLLEGEACHDGGRLEDLLGMGLDVRHSEDVEGPVHGA